MNKRKVLFVTLGVVLFVIFVLGESLVALYTDWLWFRSLGLSLLFERILNTQGLLAIVFGLLSGLVFYVNGRLSYRWGGPFVVETAQHWQFSADQLAQQVPRLVKAGSVVVGLIMGLYGAAQWDSALALVYGVPFGKVDPLFGNDISFYIFKLPFLQFLLGWLFRLLILTLLATGVIFALRLQIVVSPEGVSFRLPAKKYFTAFGTGLFLVAAGYFALARYDLLYESRGVVFGAGYADVNGLLPALSIMVVISILAASAFAFNLFRYNARLIYATLGGFAVLYVLGVYAYPAALQRFVVVPNGIAKESEYLKRDILFTRAGYGIAGIEERNLSATATLTQDSLARNDLTIKNIRLWDHRPLLETYSQIQEIRTYYKFLSVDNDRYFLNGEYRQVMLSPRELAYEALPSRVWLNEHLIYSHGYGLTLGVVNQVTQEGLPALLIQDIPPVSKTNLKVERPEIYFGEIDNDYFIVNSRLKEFDYPSGEQNVFTKYEGKAGIPIDSFFDKVLWSIRFNALKILLSSDIAPGSRVLFNRAIYQRVSRLVPFLQMDKDPYMVISKGRLFWLLDGYTTSDLYPYSRQVRGVGNYIRNSVLAVVDAYNGSVDFFVKDMNDPLIRTYANIFPGVFKPVAALDQDLRNHIRYPHWLFQIQANVYATYHMTQPQTFYNKEDLWQVPASLGTEAAMEPYYTIMRLPGEDREEFILMTPFTPSKKGNLAAWMCAKCDQEDYGKLVVYRFPKQKLVYGPQQIESRINQETEISRQLSLWDQRGSNVILGTLLVIPIEESLIYVQPLYLKAESGQIPELKRIIVAYENSIAMEETLEQSLAKLFGAAGSTPAAPAVSTLSIERKEPTGLGEEAWRHFENAQRYVREGNWAAYGEELTKLGRVLKKIKEMK